MQSVIFGGAHIVQAMSDEKFFELMPEFASVKAQQDTMHIDINSKKGCNSCNKRRFHANIDGNFATIASNLSDERARVLKKYFGLSDSQKFFIRAVNPATKQPFTKVF